MPLKRRPGDSSLVLRGTRYLTVGPAFAYSKGKKQKKGGGKQKKGGKEDPETRERSSAKNVKRIFVVTSLAPSFGDFFIDLPPII